MPVVMLTTTGRKSGQKRTTMLTSPVHDGERVVLVASYGGDAKHPAWFLTLRDDPDVEITMQGQGTARASPGGQLRREGRAVGRGRSCLPGLCGLPEAH